MSSASEQHIEAGPNESLRLKCSRIKTVLDSSFRLNSSPFLSAFKVIVLLMVIISYGGVYGLNYCGAVVNYTVIK
jgi:hypothetical protein